MHKLILFFGLTFAFASAFALAGEEISGTVTISKELQKTLAPNGILYIFAKVAGSTGGPPAAVLRIPNPKFPLPFSLSGANAMMPGTPFKGPFSVTARYSPTGDAIDKSGPQGQDKRNNIKPGQKDVKIELKAR